MLTKENFSKEHIRELQNKSGRDPLLIERTIYAFGLLEAITRVGMPFVFKGGTCLMLLLEHPMRLSTDVDIIVKPGTDVDSFIQEASVIFPFGLTILQIWSIVKPKTDLEAFLSDETNKAAYEAAVSEAVKAALDKQKADAEEQKRLAKLSAEVVFRLQKLHLGYKTGIWHAKAAFRLQIFTCQFTKLHLDLQNGFSACN